MNVSSRCASLRSLLLRVCGQRLLTMRGDKGCTALFIRVASRVSVFWHRFVCASSFASLVGWARWWVDMVCVCVKWALRSMWVGFKAKIQSFGSPASCVVCVVAVVFVAVVVRGSTRSQRFENGGGRLRGGMAGQAVQWLWRQRQVGLGRAPRRTHENSAATPRTALRAG